MSVMMHFCGVSVQRYLFIKESGVCCFSLRSVHDRLLHWRQWRLFT